MMKSIGMIFEHQQHTILQCRCCMLPNYTFYVPVESNCILEMREKRHSIKANRHWPRMYSLIHKEQADVAVKLGRNVDIPKGFHDLRRGREWPKIQTTLRSELDKVLDTFVLASISPLHMSFDTNAFRYLDYLSLARLMHSLWNYCKRLMPILTSKNNK